MMVNKSNKIFSSLQGISILSSQYPHGCNHYHSKQESIMHTNCYCILEHIKALLTTQSLTCAEISPSGSQRDQESSRTAFVQNTACPSRFEPNRHVTHHGTAASVTGTITLSLASQSFPPAPYFTHVVNNARTYASRLRKPCTHLRFASWKRVVQTPYLVSEAMVGWRPVHTHYTTNL